MDTQASVDSFDKIADEMVDIMASHSSSNLLEEQRES